MKEKCICRPFPILDRDLQTPCTSIHMCSSILISKNYVQHRRSGAWYNQYSSWDPLLTTLIISWLVVFTVYIQNSSLSDLSLFDLRLFWIISFGAVGTVRNRLCPADSELWNSVLFFCSSWITWTKHYTIGKRRIWTENKLVVSNEAPTSSRDSVPYSGDGMEYREGLSDRLTFDGRIVVGVFVLEVEGHNIEPNSYHDYMCHSQLGDASWMEMKTRNPSWLSSFMLHIFFGHVHFVQRPYSHVLLYISCSKEQLHLDPTIYSQCLSFPAFRTPPSACSTYSIPAIRTTCVISRAYISAMLWTIIASIQFFKLMCVESYKSYNFISMNESFYDSTRWWFSFDPFWRRDQHYERYMNIRCSCCFVDFLKHFTNKRKTSNHLLGLLFLFLTKQTRRRTTHYLNSFLAPCQLGWKGKTENSGIRHRKE